MGFSPAKALEISMKCSTFEHTGRKMLQGNMPSESSNRVFKANLYLFIRPLNEDLNSRICEIAK